MFTEEAGPVETATAYADQFVDAGVAKLDAAFGAGYAKQNPQALAAYVAACASNLNAFMTAAVAVQDIGFDEAFASFEEEVRPAPAPKSKGKRR